MKARRGGAKRFRRTFGALAAICLAAAGLARADQTVDVTVIPGTEGDDTIAVLTPEQVDALIASIIAEISKASATLLGSLAGNDTVTIDADLDAFSLVGTLIGSNPGESASSATSITVATGSGVDFVDAAGVFSSTADSTSAYADVLPVDDEFLPTGSQKADVSIKATSQATGLDTGADNDVVIASAELSSSAAAITGGVAAGIQASFSNSVSTKAGSVAESKAGGIQADAGNDQVAHRGTIVASATAASGVIAVEVNASDENDAERKVQGKLDASAKATAGSVGIDTDGASTESDLDVTLGLPDDAIQVTVEWSETLESGADTVANLGAVTSTASAISDSVAVGVSAAAKGSLKATINAEAKAASRGINSGAGDDAVTNAGSIGAAADAAAWVVGATISAGQGADENKAAKGKAHTSTNAIAESRATGIDADGPAASSSSTVDTVIGRSGISTTYLTSETAATGVDDVVNTGTVTVNSSALAGSRVVTVQVNAEGTAQSEANSTADSGGIGISAGGGDDAVDNRGVLTVGADATAGALAVTFDQGGEKAESKVDAKVEAAAVATGIAADGGAVDITTEISMTIDADGLLAERNRQQTTQHGDDTILNSDAVGATATALAGAAGAAVAIDGSASSDMTSKAGATAAGIDGGGGNDLVDNEGELTASADASAGALSIGFAQKVEEKAEAEVEVKATVEAEATATGLAGDSGRDVVAEYRLAIGADGLDLTLLNNAGALSGDDQLVNRGAITATANSLTGAAGVSVTIDGASAAELESKAKSHASGIDAGGGNDLVESAGSATAEASSTAGALGVAFAQKPGPKENAKAEVSAEAGATATGIAGDSGALVVESLELTLGGAGLDSSASRERTANRGDDVILATGDVTASAYATSATLGVTVAIDGAAEAEMKATAEAKAAGIQGGGGNDRVESSGLVTTLADSSAGGVAAAVGQQSSDGSKAKTKVSAETESVASATGIAGDGGQEDSVETVAVNIGSSGLSFGYEKTAIAASGDDELLNTGDVDTTAVADTAAAAVAVTVKGGAKADVDAKAEATARGLDAGGGADNITNSGTLTTDATATALTANVSVSTEGSSMANAGFLSGDNEVEAEAVGISSAGSDHQTSTVITTDIDFTDFAVTGSYEKIEDHVSGDGADRIFNSGEVTSDSFATTLAADVGVTGEGSALALGRAKVEAHAGGIESGNGDDTVENTGALTSNATATAALANVAVTGKGLAVAGNSAWDGGTHAEASAAGIDADSGEIEATTVTFEASLERAQVVYEGTLEAATGNDVVLNEGDILAQAISTAATASVAVSPKGMSAAVSTSSAESETFGIKGGGGDDRIENTGLLTSYADSLAATASVSVTSGPGVAVAADAVWDSGTKAEAKAIGIAGDGGNQSESTRLAIGTDEMGLDKDEVVADGADTILNFGDMDVDAIATTASASVAVTASSGVAAATATSTAEATAAGIDAGAGTGVDQVYNAGILDVAADAAAASASVSVVNTGVAIAADSVWDGGTTATARARGIDVGAGGDTIENDGETTATATALAGSATVAVTSTGFAGASGTSTGTADASALDASAGIDSDTIINRGALNAAAEAAAATANVTFTNTGAALALGAVWDGGTGATARARGIETGDGADGVVSTGTIAATADALAAEAAVSVTATGVAGAVATATAETDAVAIDLGGDAVADTVDNQGELTVDSNALAFSAAVSATSTGVAVSGGDVWDGGTQATARARGIETGGGADGILNTGAIGLDSDAVTAAASVSVALTGVGGAISRSTSVSDATAIDAGDDAGDDTVENSGDLTVNSDAFAAAVSAAFTSAGVSIAASGSFDGGTTAITTAKGIDTDFGSDDILNSGAIAASAGSATGQVDVSVAVSGVAAVLSNEGLSQSEAIGIDAGEGVFADSVINSGSVAASATSLGASASVGVTSAGVGATWNGGTLGDARARGIATGDGADFVDNSAAVGATADAGTLSAAISVAVTGVAGAVSKADALADATAIDVGEDDSDDVVRNSGDLTADADAHSASASVSVTVAGLAGAGGTPWDGGTHAGAQAAGLTVGGGADSIINDGAITADAASSATGVAVAVAVEGAAGAITTSNAESTATGIDSGTGDDYVESTGLITAHAFADANSVNAAGTKFGVAAAGNNVWDGGTHAATQSTGIATGSGLDEVINSGDMVIDASAVAPSTSVSFSVAGVAASISTASAEAHASAIDLGGDDDEVDNSGRLDVSADAVAVGVNVALTGAGVSAAVNSVDGGTRGTSTATAIAGAGGEDLIVNSGELDVDATVTAPSVTYSVGGIAAVASSTATADTDASAIDAGDDDDEIQNSGDVDVLADATAVTVNVAISAGAAGSVDNVWDGGTTATAVADGLRAAGGDDAVTNAEGARVGTLARATTASVGVTVAGGFGVSASSSTANASGAGIEAGTGNDLVTNAGEIDSGAEALATSLSVTMAASGIAAAGNSTWDGGTTGNADAFGIALGAGDDEATNTGSITSTADSTAIATAVAVAPLFGVAIADAVSTSNAHATAMAAGSGTDELLNEGTLTADADALAYGLNIAFTATGAAGSGLSTQLGHGTHSNALATGASGGDGADGIRNAAAGLVTVRSEASTAADAVSLALAGVAGASSNAIAMAEGAGLDGGADDDTLINQGGIDATAAADAVARTLSFAGFAGLASANSTGQAILTGLSGGDGDDWVENLGAITLHTQADAIGQSIGGSAVGFALSAANADAVAEAAGLAGGAGADTLRNAGNIAITADAATIARSVAASAAGYSLSSADTSSTVRSVGFDGGDGDDMILNEEGGSVSVASLATTSSGGAAITIFGSAQGSAKTLPRANASGASGGEGDDDIRNAGELTISARSVSTATGVGASAIGFGGADTGIEVDTSATGLDGGNGADLLVNTGTLRVGPAADAVGDARWMSLLSASGFSAGAIGSASTESVAAARTASTGMSGGADDDTLSNDGELVVIANALSRATDSTLSLFGAAGASSRSGAITIATGLDGGEGADDLESLGSLEVSAESLLIKSGGSANFTLAGTNDSSSGLVAFTEALGLAGGDGADTLVTAGTITVDALSTLDATGGSTTIAGTAAVAGTSGAETHAAGLDGGAGDDSIRNDADLDIDAMSRLTMDGTSYGFAGTSGVGANLTATTVADGILGGDGQDSITNGGNILIDAESVLHSTGGSDATFGGSSASTTSGGVTHATGIAGGADDDTLVNEEGAGIDVRVGSTVTAAAVTYTFGGGSGTDAILTGAASGEGMTGSTGNDLLRNEGTVLVTAQALLTTTGGAKATFSGGNDATGRAEAGARAVGMDGGDGDDSVVSTGVLSVEAHTIAESQNNASSSASFTSDELAGSVSVARAEAIGLEGGLGTNLLANEGDLSVFTQATGYALSYSSGASFSFDGDGESRANSTALSIATGISAAHGANDVANEGSLTVQALAGTMKDVVTELTVYRLQGATDDDQHPDGPAAETVTSLPDLTDPDVRDQYPDGTLVYCMSEACVLSPEVNRAGNHYVATTTTDDDDNTVYQWVPVAAVEALADSGEPGTFVDGQIIACTAPAPVCGDADPTINASATYWQVAVTAGSGEPPVDSYTWTRVNGLVIEVSVEVVEASFPSYAAANGNGLDGDGLAVGTGTSTAVARGIQLGDGNNEVTSQDIEVRAIANATINVASDGDVFGDSTGRTAASATATALGIELGDGANTVLNAGTLEVLAQPSAQSFTAVSAGGGVCIWFFGWWCGGEGDPTASASTTFNAAATGILAGDGGNSITNNGSIHVTAAPDVAVDARRSNAEYAGRTEGDPSGSVSVSSNATAIGIQTGSGNDAVTNNGEILVEAMDLASGCAAGTCNIPGGATVTTRATGITTGDGDDTVINNGSVIARVYAAGMPASGVGIDTGAGNDELTLGDGAEVVGIVTLGEGDDTMTLQGTAQVHDGNGTMFDLSGGDGTDTLVLAGTGASASAPTGFEVGVKTGDGTFFLPALAALDSLTLEEGGLSLGDDYAFAPDSAFSTYIHSDGDRGLLSVAGAAAADGAIAVERRGDTFIADGTRYTVVDTTAGVTGAFTDITLPQSRPLLGFSLEQTADSVDVVANAESFASVTDRRLYRELAANLDVLAGTASGDFAQQLGTIQNMSSGFGRAYASLAPDSYALLTSSTIVTGRETVQLLRQHLFNARAVAQGKRPSSLAYAPVQLAYAGGEMRVIGPGMWPGLPAVTGPAAASGGATRHGRSLKSQTWTSAFYSTGDYDFDAGYTEYDYDTRGFLVGADRLLGERTTVGLMLGYASTQADAAQAVASADVEGWTGGLYATSGWGSAYVEGGITYSTQSFENTRRLLIGTEERTAVSDHDGAALVLFAGAGREFDFGSWQAEPYGTLYYFDLEEDAFQEDGAESLNLVFERRSAEAMFAEIGSRFARFTPLRKGVLDWHAVVAYNHDFDLGDGTIGYAYQGMPTQPLRVSDRDVVTSTAVLGAGVTWLRGASTLALDYRGQYSGSYRNHVVGLRLSLRF
ncbi:MAG TPA: hypothetical protein PKL49_05970 [Steroidobacteraceae bacterium]|nr:hypothetical protein [Steroidobacteraceae bacterium]